MKLQTALHLCMKEEETALAAHVLLNCLDVVTHRANHYAQNTSSCGNTNNVILLLPNFCVHEFIVNEPYDCRFQYMVLGVALGNKD